MRGSPAARRSSIPAELTDGPFGWRDLLDPLHAALFLESNRIPLKAALEMLGPYSGAVRLPLTRATQSTPELLSRVLPPIGIAEERAVGTVRHVLAS